MSDVLNLGAARAEKRCDARAWTPVEALRQALDDVESGRIKPRVLYVAFQNPGPDGNSYPYIAAGGSNLEIQGLLAQHLHNRGRY